MSDKEAVKKLLKSLLNYKIEIVIIIGCMITFSGFNFLIPLLSKSIMDDGFLAGNLQHIYLLVILTTLISIGNTFVNILNEKIRISISSKFEYNLLECAFIHLLDIKSEYFHTTNNTEVLNNIYTDVSNITSITERGMFFVAGQLFSILGGIIGLLMIDSKMTFLVLGFLPFKYIAMKWFAKKRKKQMDDYIESIGEWAKWFGDSIRGVKDIKLFHLKSYKHKEFFEKQSTVAEKRKNINMIGEWNTASENILFQVLTMCIYIIGANMIFSLQASIGSLFAFITFSSYVTSPISSILNIGYMLSGVLPSAKRFYEFMDKPEESSGEMHPTFGDIDFQGVSFFYERRKFILRRVNLSFPRGSKTVLAGENGAGKSTVLELITKIYQPTKGTISLNGIDIEELSLQEYRDMIALVSQQIYLFNDTIKNNICLYKEIEEKKLQRATAISGLADFIKEVSYDYIVGDDGVLLSGGQKQKIALARALYHDKPIVIFDEVTSNADMLSQMRIASLLKTTLREKTVIIISHRKEDLMNADNIMFLYNGKIIQGEYRTLYRHSAKFREMVGDWDEFVDK